MEKKRHSTIIKLKNKIQIKNNEKTESTLDSKGNVKLTLAELEWYEMKIKNKYQSIGQAFNQSDDNKIYLEKKIPLQRQVSLVFPLLANKHT